MNRTIDKIKNIYSEHPRMLVATLLLILLIVMLLLFKVADKYFNVSKDHTEDFYVYVGSVKTPFTSKITTNRKGIISNFEPDKNIEFATIPIYGKDKVILPSSMEIIISSNNLREYKTSPYTVIDNGSIVMADYNGKIDNYFMFDGESLYLFSSDGKLTIDDKTIELSKYSYAICSSDGILEYYDYKSDQYKEVSYKNKVVFDSNSFHIDLKEDTVGTEGNLLSKSLEHIEMLSKYKY